MGHHHHLPTLNRAFAIAILLNLAYTILEMFYAINATSTSLLADAIHNFGDVLGLVLAWLANWLLSLPASQRYSYGFKRITIIAALANAFILAATSFLIAYQGINKLFHVTAINTNLVIIIGTLGIIINAGSSLFFYQSAHQDLNIKGAFWHLLADALILTGVVLSAFIIKFTAWLWIDPVLGLLIVVIILWGTWGLLRDSLRLILDAVPHYVDEIGVHQYLTSLPGVIAVHDLHIWGLSTKEVAMTVHLVRPDGYLSNEDYQKINHILQEKFHINHATIQIETSNTNTPCARSSGC